MKTLLQESREWREQKQIELENSGFVFDPPVNAGELSVGEMDDLLALSVGESTFTFTDVTRIA